MAARREGNGATGGAVGAAVGATYGDAVTDCTEGETGVAVARIAALVVGVTSAEPPGVGEADEPVRTLPPTSATVVMITIAAAAIASALRGPDSNARPRCGWFGDCIPPSYRARPLADVGRGRAVQAAEVRYLWGRP